MVANVDFSPKPSLYCKIPVKKPANCNLAFGCVEREDMRRISYFFSAVTFTVLAIANGIFFPLPAQAQNDTPKFEVDPSWPKPFPNLWVNRVGGVCVDVQDHVFILNRRDLADNDLDAGRQAPPIIELDADGSVLNSFGDPAVAPTSPHGCAVDRENNLWVVK